MGEDEKSEPWRQVSRVKPRLQNKNTVNDDKSENESHDREEVGDGVTIIDQSRHTVFFLFSFLPGDVVCYTLESDISIGPGSFAGSGQ